MVGMTSENKVGVGSKSVIPTGPTKPLFRPTLIWDSGIAPPLGFGVGAAITGERGVIAVGSGDAVATCGARASIFATTGVTSVIRGANDSAVGVGNTNVDSSTITGWTVIRFSYSPGV